MSDDATKPDGENGRLTALRDELRATSSDGLKLIDSPTDNPVCSIAVDETIPCLVVTWRDYATSSQLRYVLEYVIHLVEKRGIRRLLGDDTALRGISNEDQKWIAQDWLPRARKAGLEALASRLSSAYFTRIATQAIFANAPPGLSVQTFVSTAEAKQWLQSFQPLAPIYAPVILLVDDHADTREVLARLLRGEGYEVMTAALPSEAIAFLTKTTPRLVITDFNMPEQDGLQLFARVREFPHLQNVPVLMFSAAEEVKPEALRLGVNAFILKHTMDWALLHGEVKRLTGLGTMPPKLPVIPVIRSRELG